MPKAIGNPENFILLSNTQNPTGLWGVLNVGVPWFESQDPTEVRDYLKDHGLTKIPDGNGTIRRGVTGVWI